MAVTLKDFPLLKIPVEKATQFEEIVCSDSEVKSQAGNPAGTTKNGTTLFAVLKFKDGTYCAAWAGHNSEPASLEETTALLNGHERQLLAYGVKG